jgi:hypothetical protein
MDPGQRGYSAPYITKSTKSSNPENTIKDNDDVMEGSMKSAEDSDTSMTRSKEPSAHFEERMRPNIQPRTETDSHPADIRQSTSQQFYN